MGEQFCLKWNNHQSTLISLFDTLLETEKHVDCSLSAEGKVLRAHKVVLSACSPYLEELLNQHQDKYPILVFSDIKYEELKAMLDYMYRGEVNVLQEQLNGFLKAAETLQIKGLTDQGGGGGDTGGGGGSGGGAAAPAGSKRKPSVASELPSAAPQEQAAPTPKRRRARRHSQESDNSHVESGNSCDAPPLVTKAETETPRLPPVTPTPPVHTAPKLEPPEMIQPKTEYIEEMNNDDQIEDLTLDDDDEDDSYMAKPSSSHGDNSQGYDTNWQFSGDTSNSEMFMAQQDPSGNQSNSQGAKKQPRKRKSKQKRPRRDQMARETASLTLSNILDVSDSALGERFTRSCRSASVPTKEPEGEKKTTRSSRSSTASLNEELPQLLTNEISTSHPSPDIVVKDEWDMEVEDDPELMSLLTNTKGCRVCGQSFLPGHKCAQPVTEIIVTTPTIKLNPIASMLKQKPVVKLERMNNATEETEQQEQQPSFLKLIPEGNLLKQNTVEKNLDAEQRQTFLKPKPQETLLNKNPHVDKNQDAEHHQTFLKPKPQESLLKRMVINQNQAEQNSVIVVLPKSQESVIDETEDDAELMNLLSNTKGCRVCGQSFLPGHKCAQPVTEIVMTTSKGQSSQVSKPSSSAFSMTQSKSDTIIVTSSLKGESKKKEEFKLKEDTWHTCHQCKMAFRHEEALRQHTKSHETKVCKECHHTAENHMQLKKHILEQHSGQSSKVVEVVRSAATASTESNEGQPEKKSKSLRCPTCLQKEPSSADIFVHFNAFHMGRGKNLANTCLLCKEVLPHLSALKKHIVQDHSSLTPAEQITISNFVLPEKKDI